MALIGWGGSPKIGVTMIQSQIISTFQSLTVKAINESKIDELTTVSEDNLFLRVKSDRYSLCVSSNWVESALEWDEEELGIEIIRLFNCLKTFHASEVEQMRITVFEGFYRATFKFAGFERETIRFYNIEDLESFVSGCNALQVTTHESIKSMHTAIDDLEAAMSSMKQKGNSSSECQKVSISNSIQELRQKISSITPFDFSDVELSVD